MCVESFCLFLLKKWTLKRQQIILVLCPMSNVRVHVQMMHTRHVPTKVRYFIISSHHIENSCMISICLFWFISFTNNLTFLRFPVFCPWILEILKLKNAALVSYVKREGYLFIVVPGIRRVSPTTQEITLLKTTLCTFSTNCLVISSKIIMIVWYVYLHFIITNKLAFPFFFFLLNTSSIEYEGTKCRFSYILKFQWNVFAWIKRNKWI